MFEFGQPWIFLLLPLPWLLRRLLPAVKAHNTSALVVPFFARYEKVAHNTRLSKRRFSLKGSLCLLTWVLLVIAASGPQWLGQPYEIARTGRNIMLALDISGSMQIPDLELDRKPADRLTVVKHVAKAFVKRRQGDQLGLILFGSRAYLQTPLTFDLKTIRHMIDDATIGLAGPQTAMGDAIGLAVKRLSGVDKKSRVIILLTDGANNAGTVDPFQIAKMAAQEGITIYTVGLGAKRMLVPGLLGPQMVNPSADLDESALKNIAKLTHGKFFRAQNTEALTQIYREIDSLEPAVGKGSLFRPVTDYYYWPLALAFIISLLIAASHIRIQWRFRRIALENE